MLKSKLKWFSRNMVFLNWFLLSPPLLQILYPSRFQVLLEVQIFIFWNSAEETICPHLWWKVRSKGFLCAIVRNRLTIYTPYCLYESQISNCFYTLLLLCFFSCEKSNRRTRLPSSETAMGVRFKESTLSNKILWAANLGCSQMQNARCSGRW